MEEDGNSTDRLSGFSEHAVSLGKGVFAEARLGITSKSACKLVFVFHIEGSRDSHA